MTGLPLGFPPPPKLSADGKVRPLLHFVADMEDKRGATCRARELRAVASWIGEIADWLASQRSKAA